MKQLKMAFKKMIVLRHNKGLQNDLRDMVPYLNLLGLVYLAGLVLPLIILIDEVKHLTTLPFVKPLSGRLYASR